MTVTSEGLRIELTESVSGTFFDSGSPKLNGDGRDLLVTLAEELGKLPNKLSIEGHTDSKPYAGKGTYSNWELSSDRANAARRLVQGNGIRSDQVTQVRGFADQRLRIPNNPLDSGNRRISIIVQYVVKEDKDDKEEEAKPAEGEAKPSAGTEEKKPEDGKPAEKSSASPSENTPEKK